MDFIEAWAIYVEWVMSGKGPEGIPGIQEALDVLADSSAEMEENGFCYF